ncbi:MAG: helix-turn-helix transcriptional regulator [Anaerolineae bacterium]
MAEQDSLKKAERLSKLTYLLYHHPRGLTVREMSELCGVTRRTIQRDLWSLQRTGIPLWEEENRYGVLEGYFLPPLKLELNEATALYLAARLLARYSDQQNPYIISALTKLASILPESIASHVQRSVQALTYKPCNHRFDEVFTVIALGWATRRKVRIWHQAAHSENVHQYLLCPYFIEPSSEGYATYVIGHSSYFNALHTFKMERIHRAELTEETFEQPVDFDGPSLLASSWGVMFGHPSVEVRLRFSPQVTRRVKESVWHPTQRIEDCADGGCIFSVRVSMPLEMKPWIRGWGPDVEVLAPEGLREEIAEEARASVRKYEGEKQE